MKLIVAQILLLFTISSLPIIQSERFSQRYRQSMQRLSDLVSSSHGEPINSIVDVGANTGDWTRMIKEYFPHSKLFMIEGNPKLESKLKKIGVPYAISLVGERSNQSVEFHSHRIHHTGGSIFREHLYQTKNRSNIITETFQTQRIDDILQRMKFPRVNFLKLDIQGSEFNALHGAIKTLKQATYLTLEVSLHQYNPGAVQFSDINIFLEKRGFRLFDVVDLRHGLIYSPNIQGLIQADYLWAKANSQIFNSVMTPPVHQCRRRRSRDQPTE